MEKGSGRMSDPKLHAPTWMNLTDTTSSTSSQTEECILDYSIYIKQQKASKANLCCWQFRWWAPLGVRGSNWKEIGGGFLAVVQSGFCPGCRLHGVIIWENASSCALMIRTPFCTYISIKDLKEGGIGTLGSLQRKQDTALSSFLLTLSCPILRQGSITWPLISTYSDWRATVCFVSPGLGVHSEPVSSSLWKVWLFSFHGNFQ